jgi:hypothetical protein
MRCFYIYIFILIFNILTGQIVVRDNTLPRVGDTLRTATDNLPTGINPGNSGPNQFWDFSSLQAPFISEQVLKPRSAGEHGSQFPTASFFVDAQGDGEVYYRMTPTQQFQMGFVGNPPGGFNIQVTGRYNPNYLEKRVPMNYEESGMNSANLSIPFSAEILPDTLFTGLPLRPDSIRLLTEQVYNSTIDAWGTMTIPTGTFNVLREKRVTEFNRKIEAKSNAIPVWINISDLVPIPGLSGMDTTITYYYWSDNTKEPIAVVQTAEMGSQVTNVQFKADNSTVSTSYVPSGNSGDVHAYPNPAIGAVRFDFIGVKDGNYTLKIFNILGVEVWSKKYQITGGKRTVKLDLDGYQKGTYLYSLTDDKGKPIITKRLIVLRP